MDSQKVGKTIKSLRLKRNLSQQNVADYLGISFQAVSKWERGLCLPDASYLAKLARLLDIELDDLLEGNIQYLSDAWVGLLIFTGKYNIQTRDNILFTGKTPLIDILLSYFMLAGIKQIAISGQGVDRVMEHLGDGSQYGISIRYNVPIEKKNTMIVYDTIFAYGTNLTKYFWNAMARSNGVSILTTENIMDTEKVACETDGLAYKNTLSATSILPITFLPARYMQLYSGVPTQWLNRLIEEQKLYVEPTARGLTTRLVQNTSDCEDVQGFVALTERMTGQKVGDCKEIAQRRQLVSGTKPLV